MRSDYINTNVLSHILWAMTPADRLISEIALQTGWRIDDILELETESIKHALELKRPALTITEKKTGKRSRKQLPRRLLQECLQQAGRFYVFEGRDDWRKHRTRQAVFLDLKRVAKKFKIKCNFSPHSLRKNYAVYMRENFGFEAAQKALNHTNPNVTFVYAFSDLDEMKSAKKRKRATGKQKKSRN